MIYSLYREQWIPASLEEVWNFFSFAGNLSKLTPSEFQMKIVGKKPVEEIYPGQIIAYKLKPLWAIPVAWVTEITHVVPLHHFVDEQRKGPYRLWHHQHHFQVKDGGVLMKDIVHYQLPLGFFGRWAHRLFLKTKLERVFNFRQTQIQNLFPLRK